MRDLPIPASPFEQRYLTLARLGQGPAVEKQRKLVLAPDQRQDGAAAMGLEAPLGGAQADHAERGDLLVSPFTA